MRWVKYIVFLNHNFVEQISTPTKIIRRKQILITGDRCSVTLAYEHQLKRFPASLIVGPFGAARGRDFLCVQCLDGGLLFFEQEVYSFSRTLKERLLPEPIVYVTRNDLFVTHGSDWCIQCYRYQSIAEVGRREDAEGAESSKTIAPDWSYNIGEPIIGIHAVVLSSFEIGMVVLGERTLFCLGDACTSIKTSKRLEYSSLCFLTYVIEPDGKLMVLVVADTNTLMIYEGTTLRWSAQLPFTPVTVSRINLQNVDAPMVVILSEDGLLEICYLGTEPSLFVAPPIQRRGYDYVAAERELMELRSLSKKSASKDAQVTNAMLESELTINAMVSPELFPSPHSAFLGDDIGEDNKDSIGNRQCSMCKISVELTSYATLQDIQLYIDAPKPLVATKNLVYLSNLCDRYVIQTEVYLGGDTLPLGSELEITVSYTTESGDLRVAQKIVQLPLRLLLRPCQTEANASFSLAIKSTESVPSFSQLFPEFMGESRQGTSSLGLQHCLGSQIVGIAHGSGLLNRYRVQASEPASIPLVLQQLISRLTERTPAVADKLSSGLSQQHLQLLGTKLDAHFAARLKARDALKEIALLTCQLRAIEKRMLRGLMREHESRSSPAGGLPNLLESTYRSLFHFLDQLQAARVERERTWHGLHGFLKLLLILVRLGASSVDEKCAMLEAAIAFEPQLRDQVDWEEIMDSALVALKQSDRANANWARFESERDLGKLKKRLSHALERLASSNATGIKESFAEE
ncbi:hypothetical protein QAD02_011447 [Eretmocerus hayati]|uniref:Uncharacterized protein n=1 Tax=Eretmocerus hayati TaxID=131215 RepID=A0ACC2NY00_9HYME|nr:hypothetical protein QAD02_011447 [Eretmocerus hayati]